MTNAASKTFCSRQMPGERDERAGGREQEQQRLRPVGIRFG